MNRRKLERVAFRVVGAVFLAVIMLAYMMQPDTPGLICVFIAGFAYGWTLFYVRKIR